MYKYNHWNGEAHMCAPSFGRDVHSLMRTGCGVFCGQGAPSLMRTGYAHSLADWVFPVLGGQGVHSPRRTGYVSLMRTGYAQSYADVVCTVSC